jgi:FtsP/CotA-like multicopper oxidase with cupredoxin domain
MDVHPSRHLLSLVGLIAGAGCGTSAPDETAATGPASYDEIALAEAEDVDPQAAVVEVRLRARPVADGGNSEGMWGYEGVVPGPVIRGRRGDTLVVHFENGLPEATTIHWHGLRVPNDMDGVAVAQAPVPPGGSFTYRFELLDAGTFWYHPHHLSADQVERGLYAPLVVEDPAGEPAALGRPVLLVLSDAGPEAGRGTDAGVRNGREGPRLLVNGREQPTVAVARGARQRWRLINAARSRFFLLEVAGHALVRIGGDGGLLEAPAAPSDRLLLVPGERAEVALVLQGAVGDRVAVRAHHYHRGADRDDVGADGFGDPAPVDLMYLRLAEGGGGGPDLPGRLRNLEELTVPAAVVEQSIRIGERAQGFVINEQPGGTHPHLRARVGETQLFSVTNHTRFDHPFHLHGFFFQRVDPQTRRPAAPVEWKDTLNLPALSSALLAVRFDDRPGLWMFHCHILDHADLGLMGMIELTR